MQYLRDCWYMAGWAKDFGRKPAQVTILNEMIAVYRGDSNALHALRDRCPHKSAPLSLGRVEGEDLRCMYHGLKFGPDGGCVEVPSMEMAPPALCTRSYPVAEAYSAVWVWMGAPERADIDIIPPFVGIEDPNWRMLPGRMDFEAHYSLINENLLDLSHVAYVHQNSFGGGAETPKDRTKSVALAKPIVEKLPRGLRLTRIAQNAPVGVGLFRQVFDGLADSWSVVDFLAPGIFLAHADIYRAGSTDAAGGARPSDEHLIHRAFTCQAVTPITDRKTCYHYALGPWTQSPLNPEAFAELGAKAFEEDRVMINAQQRIIDANPHERPIALPIDREGSEFDRVMRRLIEEEARPRATMSEEAPGADRLVKA